MNETNSPGGFSPEEIAAAEKRLDTDGPWYTTRQVIEHLQSLDPPMPSAALHRPPTTDH